MKDCKITFKTTESMRDQLKELAAKRDVAVSQIIREALKEYFQEVDEDEYGARGLY